VQIKHVIELVETGAMRVEIVENFQTGGIKTIQGRNSMENAIQGPGIKLRASLVSGPENNFQSPGIKFYRPVTTRFQATLIFK
jgi:hypothetical protein